jgi:hypothetical protein
MSQDLLYTYVTGFDRAIRETVEVKGGKLRKYVMKATGDLYREEGVYQRTSGGGLPQKKTNRFGDSPVSELDYSRRRVSRTPFDDGQFMDWADVVRMGTDPRSNKLTAMRNKFLRQEDIILDQAMLGVAKGGDNGETDTAFDTDNIIGVATGAPSGKSDAGWNYEKFTSAITQFGNNNVDLEFETPVFKMSWNQWYNMVNDDKFINFDYTKMGPIDKKAGVLFPYMGCMFCVSNIVPYMNAASTGFNIDDSDINQDSGKWNDTDSTEVRAVTAFVEDAALLEINPDITTEIDKRADKGFNWYAYLKMDLGAVRMEEEKVIAIPCKEGTLTDV